MFSFSSKLISFTFIKLIRKNEFSRLSHKILHKMNVAYFRRCLPTEGSSSQPQQLQISFHYKNQELCIDRDFNFCRNINEIIDIFLERIRNNIEKELTKKLKKKKSKKNSDVEKENKRDTNEAIPITVKMFRKNEPISNVSFEELLRNEDAYTDLVLRILENDFQVTYNLPWVVNMSLPSSILAGFILYPSKLETQYAEKEYSHGMWYRGLMPKSKNIKEIEWYKIHEGLTYETSNDDIGHHIKFELIPKNSKVSGPSAECISKNEVQAGPGLCPFDNRHQFTNTRLVNENEFRVVSYNILADIYADSDYTRKELFPYCPPYALHIDYRKQLFIKEILGYNADLVCLQEVDAKIFDCDLIPVLEIDGYSGVFKQKGKTGEGLATFYRKDRFELIEDYSFNIGENIEKMEIFSNIWEKIKINQKLIKRVINRSTTLQVNLLRSKDTGNLLLIANTHLYFHPDADHIRLLQSGICMIYLEDVYKKIITNIEESKTTLSLLFCGDFNSVPECGIYKLMTEKYVDKDFIDWQSNEEEAIKDVCLSQSFNIKSACGCPEYTNYTVGFYGCLDYIFYQTDNLIVKQIIPFPIDEEIKANIAIPSIVFPSDHIALVADLEFR